MRHLCYRFTFLPLLFFFFPASPSPVASSPPCPSSAFLFFPASTLTFFLTLTIVDLPFPLVATCLSAALQSADASLMAYLHQISYLVTERLAHEHESLAKVWLGKEKAGPIGI